MSSKPVEFEAVKPEKVIIDGEEREKTSHYKPKGLRWSDVKAMDKKTLSLIIDVEKNYNFRPYSYTPQGVTLLMFYSDSSKDVSMVPRTNIPHAVLCFLAIVAPVLLPSKLDMKESVASYRPQRILKQFGFDRRVV